MPALKRGVLIALEGIDGSGKSTLAKNLSQHLSNSSFPVFQTQEPGKTALGKLIKPVVQQKNIPLCAKAEFLLFAADRAQHFNELVMPALDKNMLVISDRMADSSLAYQGYGRGLDLTTLANINAWAMETRNPDLVLYVKITPEQARDRILQRGIPLSSFEQEREQFIQTLYDGFNALFAQRSNVITLDGMLNKEDLTHRATERIITWLQQQALL